MEAYIRNVMSGRARDPFAALLRLVTRVVEPIYAGITSSRNALYRSGALKSHRAPRPVVSIGNITTGGTGKTPVVCWLAEKLRERGMHPAVLLRGYKSASDSTSRAEDIGSDEAKLLDRLLNVSLNDTSNDRSHRIPVHAQPDRVEGAMHVMEKMPSVDVFIIDDGFQHQRLYRDFDLVLIDATNPFGFDHVLPRGLLREPLTGLRRATAVLITRVDQALPGALDAIERTIDRCAPRAAIYRSRHAQTAIVDSSASATSTAGLIAVEVLNGKTVFAFCGIGNPQAFEQQLKSAGAAVVGRRFFADHYAYDARDAKSLVTEAKRLGAAVLITTDKDWVKLSPLRDAFGAMPVWRVQLRIRFMDDDEERLLVQIVSAIDEAR